MGSRAADVAPVEVGREPRAWSGCTKSKMGGLSRRSLLRVAAAGGAAAAMGALVVGASADWQAEWDELVAAARAEGRVSLVTWGTTWGGSGFRTVFDAFEHAFPGVVVDPWLADGAASAWLG